MNKNDIRNLSFDELNRYFKQSGAESFRAAQVFEWVYQKNVWYIKDMKNLSISLREKLSEDFNLKQNNVARKEISGDGTTKFLFELEDHEKVETVMIPTETRTTVCVSTQAGCKFGCKFCASGIGGWKRNLTTAEIMTQVLHVKEEALKRRRPLSHVVFMGVGEPLDNMDNLMRAIRIINDNKGLNIGARRITISTCGVIPNIHELGKQGLQLELAISLHGYDNESRNVLMPVNKKYPFDKLLEACRSYINATKRQITFEYILIKDITCSKRAVKALKKSFKGLICKMNLIPYNPVTEFDHKTPSRQEMVLFKKSLEESRIHATIRAPRGRDINGACGQLRHKAN